MVRLWAVHLIHLKAALPILYRQAVMAPRHLRPHTVSHRLDNMDNHLQDNTVLHKARASTAPAHPPSMVATEPPQPQHHHHQATCQASSRTWICREPPMNSALP